MKGSRFGRTSSGPLDLAPFFRAGRTRAVQKPQVIHGFLLHGNASSSSKHIHMRVVAHGLGMSNPIRRPSLGGDQSPLPRSLLFIHQVGGPIGIGRLNRCSRHVFAAQDDQSAPLLHHRNTMRAASHRTSVRRIILGDEFGPRELLAGDSHYSV